MSERALPIGFRAIRRIDLVSLAAIVLLAALIRFQGLNDQGIFFFDEARYLAEAQRLARETTEIFRHPFDWNFRQSANSVIERTDGGMARPLHIVFVALANSENRALHLHAFIGVVTVAFAWRFGWPAGLLLATSAAHSFYSRTMLAEVDAALILLMSLVVLHRRPHLAGFLLGAALLIQSRMTLVIPFILFMDFLTERSYRRLARIIVGVSIPIALCEGFYLLLKISGAPDPFLTYFEQIRTIANWDTGRIRFNRIFFAPGYLAAVEGIPFLILFSVGLIYAFKSRRRELVLIAAVAIWVMAIGTIFDPVRQSGTRYGRMLSPAIPLIMIVAGCAIRGKIGIAILALVMFARFETLAEISAMKSDYREIYRTVAHEGGVFFSDQPLHLERFGARLAFGDEKETTVVIVYDPSYASNFAFYHALPDTPAVILPRSHRPSRLERLETIGSKNDRIFLAAPRVEPARIYLLPPGDERAMALDRPF